MSERVCITLQMDANEIIIYRHLKQSFLLIYYVLFQNKLSARCKVSGIPSLALFDSEGNKLKTDGDFRSHVAADPEGEVDIEISNKTSITTEYYRQRFPLACKTHC